MICLNLCLPMRILTLSRSRARYGFYDVPPAFNNAQPTRNCLVRYISWVSRFQLNPTDSRDEWKTKRGVRPRGLHLKKSIKKYPHLLLIQKRAWEAVNTAYIFKKNIKFIFIYLFLLKKIVRCKNVLRDF